MKRVFRACLNQEQRKAFKGVINSYQEDIDNVYYSDADPAVLFRLLNKIASIFFDTCYGMGYPIYYLQFANNNKHYYYFFDQWNIVDLIRTDDGIKQYLATEYPDVTDESSIHNIIHAEIDKVNSLSDRALLRFSQFLAKEFFGLDVDD